VALTSENPPNNPINQFVISHQGGVQAFYYTEWGHRIKKWQAPNQYTTIAGQLGVLGRVDGALSTAKFNFPQGIDIDESTSPPTLWVADRESHALRKVDVANNQVTSCGGYGHADGSCATAGFKKINDISVYGSGGLIIIYAAEAYQGRRVRKINWATQEVTTLAGDRSVAGAVDGSLLTARFSQISRLVVDSAGRNLYLTDEGNHLIRKVSINIGQVTTIGGTQGVQGNLDGALGTNLLDTPKSIHIDESDSTAHLLYFGSDGNDRIRALDINSKTTYAVGGVKTGGTAWVNIKGDKLKLSRPESIRYDKVASSQSNPVVYYNDMYARRIIKLEQVSGATWSPTAFDPNGVVPPPPFVLPTSCHLHPSRPACVPL